MVFFGCALGAAEGARIVATRDTKLLEEESGLAAITRGQSAVLVGASRTHCKPRYALSSDGGLNIFAFSEDRGIAND